MSFGGVDSADGHRGAKSESAFRTISEVADDLGLKQHVLRFWETKFSAIKPLKRGGGRRYYRPEDVALLECIRDLLYNDGYTIKGVQKVLRDTGGKPEKIREGIISAEPSQPKSPPPPVQASAPVLSRADSAEVVSTSLSSAAKDELRAVLRELTQLKSKLDSALSRSIS